MCVSLCLSPTTTNNPLSKQKQPAMQAKHPFEQLAVMIHHPTMQTRYCQSFPERWIIHPCFKGYIHLSLNAGYPRYSSDPSIFWMRSQAKTYLHRLRVLPFTLFINNLLLQCCSPSQS